MEWPWTLTLVVRESRRLLSYYELPKDMRPPASILHSPWKCAKWIEDHMPGEKKGSGMLEFDDAQVERA